MIPRVPEGGGVSGVFSRWQIRLLDQWDDRVVLARG